MERVLAKRGFGHVARNKEKKKKEKVSKYNKIVKKKCRFVNKIKKVLKSYKFPKMKLNLA